MAIFKFCYDHTSRCHIYCGIICILFTKGELWYFIIMGYNIFNFPVYHLWTYLLVYFIQVKQQTSLQPECAKIISLFQITDFWLLRFWFYMHRFRVRTMIKSLCFSTLGIWGKSMKSMKKSSICFWTSIDLPFFSLKKNCQFVKQVFYKISHYYWSVKSLKFVKKSLYTNSGVTFARYVLIN